MKNTVVANNKKAFHEYHILETYEAGVQLKGSEVKSIREGKVSLKESYVLIRKGEAWLRGAHIASYSHTGFEGHELVRNRKLLLHRKEMDKINEMLTQKGKTLIPMSLYFKKDLVKVKFAVGTGKKNWDKRHDKMDQDVKRQLDREVKRVNNR